MSEPVQYRVDLTHRKQHLFTVHVRVPADCASHATLSLPCWTPGSYLRRDYVRHLQQITACADDGTEVLLSAIDGDTWQLPAHLTHAVTVTLELFANEPSVRTNMVDATSALIIPAATMLAVDTARDREHHVTIPPTDPSHTVYSLLPARDDAPHTFVANDYDHLIDSAFSCGEHATVDVTIDTVPHHIVWAGPADKFDAAVVADSVTKLAHACASVFDTPLVTPQYTVLTLTGPVGSGGLEHRDGAVLHVPEHTFQQPETTVRFHSLLAHEYLHAWNVKRLAPKELMRLRYDQVVRTSSLWFAEGFTAYYDGLLCVRTGLWDYEQLLERFSRIYTELARTPGVSRQSLQDASWRAPERQYRRDENAPNAMTEYYAHGSLVALELDAWLRGENPASDGLDALMRLLWQRHHTSGYTDTDVFAAVQELAGETIANRLIDRVCTPGLADLDEFTDAIQALGLTVQQDLTDTGWFGMHTAAASGTPGVRVTAALRDGPAWQAGIVGGDIVLAVDDTVITARTFADVATRYAPGDTAVMKLLRHNRIDAVALTVGHAPAAFTVTPNRTPTDGELATFHRWLHTTVQPGSDA